MMVTEKIKQCLFKEVSAAPLAVFRFAFGVMMFFSLIRFVSNGWVEELYIKPKFFFTYYGFAWVKPLNDTGMYLVFGAMILAAVLIAFNLFYRLSIILFFLLFTYVELIDKTNYLNHYYFISIVSFLLCALPSNTKTVPRWAIATLQLQMAIVYFFAGIAKINSDWLFSAMPLKLWLSASTHLPWLGSLLSENWVAYVFSWCGMLFDVSIAFFLFNRKTVWYAYAVVIVFHVLTAILFPMIGMFPFIMMVCAAIFLPATFHQRIINYFHSLFHSKNSVPFIPQKATGAKLGHYIIPAILIVHFTVQLALPFRYLLYPANIFWHEQGYRFSWRVMLMEKAGLVFFKVRTAKGELIEVNNRNYLTTQQEKQMSTQPDMILQFAHFLQTQFNTQQVFVEAYVTVNGRGSRLFIDPKINLATVQDNFATKKWILAAAK